MKTADSAVIMRNMTTADFREPYGQLFAHDRQELVTGTVTELHRTMRMAEGSVPKEQELKVNAQNEDG